MPLPALTWDDLAAPLDEQELRRANIRYLRSSIEDFTRTCNKNAGERRTFATTFWSAPY
jgi:hypothetical protein